jgi:hypothetical protein
MLKDLTTANPVRVTEAEVEATLGIFSTVYKPEPAQVEAKSRRRPGPKRRVREVIVWTTDPVTGNSVSTSIFIDPDCEAIEVEVDGTVNGLADVRISGLWGETSEELCAVQGRVRRPAVEPVAGMAVQDVLAAMCLLRRAEKILGSDAASALFNAEIDEFTLQAALRQVSP